MDLKELKSAIRHAVASYLKWWHTKNVVPFGNLGTRMLVTVDGKDYLIVLSIEELENEKK